MNVVDGNFALGNFALEPFKLKLSVQDRKIFALSLKSSGCLTQFWWITYTYYCSTSKHGNWCIPDFVLLILLCIYCFSLAKIFHFYVTYWFLYIGLVVIESVIMNGLHNDMIKFGHCICMYMWLWMVKNVYNNVWIIHIQSNIVIMVIETLFIIYGI